ncbi:MAG: hypothetical protein J2P55_15250 [Rhizobiales bacterium]|nr:hypothetical protein [Hyphomicrobiales bacterium]
MPQDASPKNTSPQDTPPQSPSSRRSGDRSPQLPPRAPRARLAARLILIPLIGVVAGLLYYGLHDRFFLPECDSDRAKRTLGDILKQLRLEPTRYEPITTVSSSKTQVMCNAVLPLLDGGKVVIDYSFYWQGSQANIRYSVTRK